MIQDSGRTEATETAVTEDDSFLSRWSKRKRQIERTEPVAVPPQSESLPQPEVGPGESKAGSPERPAAEAEPELPPIESLDENSDYRPFLSSKVSDKVQRMALRKLFASAGFNVRDGLDDYDDDFTVFEPLGDIITADMKHQAEVEAARERARRRAAGETDADDDALAGAGEPEQAGAEEIAAAPAAEADESAEPQAAAADAAAPEAGGPDTTGATRGRRG